jgi:hypothetical protein
MWGPYRQSLIKRHQFYVKQARKRVLSQFENMEEEADKAAEEWLEQSSGRFDPDWHDPGISMRQPTMSASNFTSS